MFQKQQVNGLWRDAGRRVRAWAWDTDHDDTVPTVLAWLLPLAILILLVATYVSLWMVLGMVLMPAVAVFLVRGRTHVLAAQRTIDDGRRQLSSPSATTRRIER